MNSLSLPFECQIASSASHSVRKVLFILDGEGGGQNRGNGEGTGHMEFHFIISFIHGMRRSKNGWMVGWMVVIRGRGRARREMEGLADNWHVHCAWHGSRLLCTLFFLFTPMEFPTWIGISEWEQWKRRKRTAVPEGRTLKCRHVSSAYLFQQPSSHQHLAVCPINLIGKWDGCRCWYWMHGGWKEIGVWRCRRLWPIPNLFSFQLQKS